MTVSGASAYLEKSINETKLLNTIHAHLSHP